MNLVLRPAARKLWSTMTSSRLWTLDVNATAVLLVLKFSFMLCSDMLLASSLLVLLATWLLSPKVLGERPYSIKEELNKFVTAGANPFMQEMGSTHSKDGENNKDESDGQESNRDEPDASQAQSTGTEAKAGSAQA